MLLVLEVYIFKIVLLLKWKVWLNCMIILCIT